MSKGAPRILIIKTHAIGDLLMTTPAIRDIRRANPGAHIVLLVGKWSAPAVRHNPHIDELIEVDDAVFLGRRNWWALAGLLLKVRRFRFDKAFIFHPLPLVHLFARLSSIPLRFGLTKSSGSRHLSAGVEEDLGSGVYYPENFLRVVALDGAPTGAATPEVHASEEDEAAADRLLCAADVDPAADFILIAPGGARNSKEEVGARRWPVEKFVELVALICRDQPGLRILVTGAPSDAKETAYLAGAIPGSVDLTGRTSLPDLFSLARRARAIVGNDSSLLHIAMGVGTPAVIPFGPTGAPTRVPAWALPYTIQADLPCSPCYVGGAFPGCDIGYKCLRDLPVSLVYDKLRAALAAKAPVS